jgi:hypothetical protein
MTAFPQQARSADPVRHARSAPETQRFAAFAWIAIFLFSLPLVTPRIYASDEVQYFSYLRSLWFDRDLDFENEYTHFYESGSARSDGFHETFLERTTEAGRRINFATIGCALLWAPFYAIGDGVARALQAGGRPIAADGYSWPYVAAVSYASALYGFLALLIARHLARRLGGPASALAARASMATVAVWIGTPLLFYMYIAPPMSHATSAFAVALCLLAWIRAREGWRPGPTALLGITVALMAMVREQDAFVAIAPAFDWIVTVARSREGRERSHLLVSGAAGVAACLVAYIPQVLAYLALNGHIGPSRLVARKMTWTAPHALEVLGAPAHGFFIWTPLAVLAITGLFFLPRLARAAGSAGVLTISLLLAVAAQVYVAGSVESWTVAGAFGQRRFVALTTVLVIGLAALLAGLRPRALRIAAAAIVLVCIWWNVALMAQFGAGLMDRQRLEPARLAYNAFVVLPRELPELAWRYVFDRPSFYEQQQRLRERSQ